MKPFIEQLEPRDCPSGIMGLNQFAPAPSPVFPTPLAGQQVVMWDDVLANIPVLPGTVHPSHTPAEPMFPTTLAALQPVLAAATFQGIDDAGEVYWFVPNSALPPGWVPGADAPVTQSAAVQPAQQPLPPHVQHVAAAHATQPVESAGLLAAALTKHGHSPAA
jgi:hypothetical protein